MGDVDDYLIRGEKMWLTHGPQVDWMCMRASDTAQIRFDDVRVLNRYRTASK